MAYYGSQMPSRPAPNTDDSRRLSHGINDSLYAGSPYYPPSYGLGLPDMGYNITLEAVRKGYVSVKEDGFASFLWSRKWLVLRENFLSFHKDANAPQSSMLLLADVIIVDRTDAKPYCLLIETKDRQYHLAFKSDDELYGWKDDIYARSPLMGFSNPFNFVHKIHSEFDPITGSYTGLPDQWNHLLVTSAITNEDYAQNPTENKKRQSEETGTAGAISTANPAAATRPSVGQQDTAPLGLEANSIV